MARDKNLEELKEKQEEKEFREQEKDLEMTDSGRVPDLEGDTEDSEDEKKQ